MCTKFNLTFSLQMLSLLAQCGPFLIFATVRQKSLLTFMVRQLKKEEGNPCSLTRERETFF